MVEGRDREMRRGEEEGGEEEMASGRREDEAEGSVGGGGGVERREREGEKERGRGGGGEGGWMRCSFLLDASWRTVHGATPSKDNNNVDLRANMGVHLDTTRPFYFKEGFCIT